MAPLPPAGSEDTHPEALESDEAPTPAWLPLVGFGLLLSVFVAFLASRPEGIKSSELAAARASAAAEPSADLPMPTPSVARGGARAAALPAEPASPPGGCAQ
jgi:hypothetical protein